MSLRLKNLFILFFIYACAFCIFNLPVFANQESPTNAVNNAGTSSNMKNDESVSQKGNASQDVKSENNDKIIKSVATPEVEEKKSEVTAVPAKPIKRISRVIAVFETTAGNFKARLFFDKSPKTVENFVNLAEGKLSWKDPNTGDLKNTPFYDGLGFYAVRKGVMVMTGDPRNKGKNGSGITIPDEINGFLSHDKPGILSMGNHGKQTADSRFFITLAPLKHLDKSNTIFGEVIEGMEVVEQIGNSPVFKMNDRPRKMTFIKTVKIITE